MLILSLNWPGSHYPDVNITYLTDLPLNELQERLRHLPNRSIVLYLSLYKDAQGRAFLNATEALPLVTAASSAPVFGISDTYLGHGIVGGFVASFEEQGKIASRDVLEILGGKSAQDIPVVYGPSMYLFDWRELRRWNLDQRKLPPGSTVLFRKRAWASAAWKGVHTCWEADSKFIRRLGREQESKLGSLFYGNQNELLDDLHRMEWNSAELNDGGVNLESNADLVWLPIKRGSIAVNSEPR